MASVAGRQTGPARPRLSRPRRFPDASLPTHAFAAAMVCRLEEDSMGLDGIWEVLAYRLSGGDEHPTRGRIFFSQNEWSVLFFVLDRHGGPARASAEGGRYRVEGDQLLFIHRYHFSGGRALEGLPAAPFKMEIQEAVDSPREPCSFSLEGPELMIRFPSGNSMRFRRLAEG